MTASVSRSIIISGSIDVDPERRDEALQAGLRFMQQTRQREGCLAYTWSPDLAVPGRIWVYERWRDQAALARQLASEPYLEMRNTDCGPWAQGLRRGQAPRRQERAGVRPQGTTQGGFLH